MEGLIQDDIYVELLEVLEVRSYHSSSMSRRGCGKLRDEWIKATCWRDDKGDWGGELPC